MLLISFTLALIAVVAGMMLLAQAKKESLGNFYKIVAWFVIVLSFLAVLCTGTRSVCHHRDHQCMFMRGHDGCMMGGGCYGMMGCPEGTMGGSCEMMHRGCCNHGCMDGGCGSGNSCTMGQMGQCPEGGNGQCHEDKDGGSCPMMQGKMGGSCMHGMMETKDTAAKKK